MLGTTGEDAKGIVAGTGADVRGCSLRMAVIAAENTPSVDDAGDKIVFAKDIVEKGNAVMLDAALTITERNVTIDGCGLSDPAVNAIRKDNRPCVDIKQSPKTDGVFGFLANAPGSVTPDDPRGIVVLAQNVAISGLAFHNGNPAVWVPATTHLLGVGGNSEFALTNSYFGLTKGGAQVTDGDLDVGVLISGDQARIGGSVQDKEDVPELRNIFAQGDIGVLVAGASNTEIGGNWFGLGNDGKALGEPDDQLQTGVKVVGLGADATVAADSLEALAGIPEANQVDDAEASTSKSTATGTDIGAGTVSCAAPCNIFAGIAEHAIDLGGDPLVNTGRVTSLASGEPVGAEETTIKNNQIGIDAAGIAAGVEDDSILIRNATKGTEIGGDVNGEMNLISNSGGAGVSVHPEAGMDTTFARNRGSGNLDPIFDLGDDSFGNAKDGPNGGIQPPVITSAEPGVVTGTAEPGARIRVFQATANGNGIEKHVGDVPAVDASGAWKLARPVVGGQRLVATADLRSFGTSEVMEDPFTVITPTTDDEEETTETGTSSTIQTTSTVLTTPTTTTERPQPPDEEPPTVVRVAGEENPTPAASKSEPIVVSRREPLAGQATDPSGIREVFVALGVPDAKRKGTASAKKKRVRKCNFVHIKFARIVKRNCKKPLFFKAQGTDDWKLPLSRKARSLLMKSEYVTLYLEITDTQGNIALRRYRVKFTKASSESFS